MTQREKILAGTVGMIAVLWVGSSGLTRYRDAFEANRSELREAEQEVSQARTAKLRGQRAMTKLRRWQKQSLPTNADIANSLYQDWLQKQMTEAGLKVADIKSSAGLRGGNDRTQEFTYVVTASGQMSQLVDFLSRFYQAGHLQRISRASLAPAKEGNDLSITLTVDALSMRDSPRTDTLSDLKSDLKLPPLEELQAAIAKRDLFAPFKDTAVVASKPQENEADQAFISGMGQGDGGWYMSIRMKDSGKMMYFRAGDSIQIGKFTGKVSEIDGRRAIVEQEGNRLQIFLGQSLGQAQPVTQQAG
jgi:hypothetical protein